MADDSIEPRSLARNESVALVRRGYPRAAFDLDSFDAAYDYGFEPKSKGPEFLVSDTWRKVRKHKWLILSLVLIATSLTTIEMYRRKSVYRATAVIEIGKEEYAPVKQADIIFQDPSEAPTPANLKTKMYILKSDPVLEDVVTKLGLDRRSDYWTPPKMSVTQAIQALFKRASEPRGSQRRFVAKPDPVEAGNGGPSANRIDPSERSEKLEPYVASLRSALEVENVKDTQLLSLSFTHTRPEIAEAVTNGVATVFIDRNFDSKTEKFTRSSDWLDRTTRELQAKVEQAERELADYTREHNLFSLDGKETLTTGKITSLNDQALRAHIDRLLKESLYVEVKQGHITQLPEAFSDLKVNELQRKQSELTVQVQQLGVTYGPLNPKVIEIKEEIRALQQEIDKGLNGLAEKLKADYERAVRDEDSLNAALDRAKGEATQQNQLAIQLTVLKQNLDTTKSLYTEFLQRSSQAKIQVVEQNNNVRIIQPAKLPRSPIGPNRWATILASLGLSLMLGVGVALLIEYLDKSIKTVDDVVRYTQLPTLAVIPTVPSLVLSRREKAAIRWVKAKKSNSPSLPGSGAEAETQSMIALDARSSAAEAYRTLRTSVLLSASERPPKMVLVSSGRSGEGKTTTVVNTAISLAQLGASVLIIDCDLRKPSIHRVLKVSNSRGLTTYLSRTQDIDSVIVRTEFPSLSVLPSGPLPPNPAELISSPKMKHLLKDLASRYDHILLDSPPILNVTDSVVLSTLVDGVILVVHGGKSTRDGVRRTCEELFNVGAKNYGVVLNNIDLHREGYDDSYARYFYQERGVIEESEA